MSAVRRPAHCPVSAHWPQLRCRAEPSHAAAALDLLLPHSYDQDGRHSPTCAGGAHPHYALVVGFAARDGGSGDADWVALYMHGSSRRCRAVPWAQLLASNVQMQGPGLQRAGVCAYCASKHAAQSLMQWPVAACRQVALAAGAPEVDFTVRLGGCMIALAPPE